MYNPASVNGRLLLGLKGQISELELGTIRARCNAGILSRASRGEYAAAVPAGYERLEGGSVVKDPNVEVQKRIELVFAKTEEIGSIYRTANWFFQNELLVPRRDRFGALNWQPATVGRMNSIISNPAYAGAAVYGKTCSKTEEKTGKMVQVELPQEQWRFCIKDKFAAYITWERFEKLQAMKRDNHSEYQRKLSRGIARGGDSLLQGILYCGSCGRKMHVRYRSSGPQYVCRNRSSTIKVSTCQALAGESIDQHVRNEFFAALKESEIDLSATALNVLDRDHQAVLLAREQEVERKRYESQLAERQFLKSDPDHRLVTTELERRWEAALESLRRAEESLRAVKSNKSIFAIPSEFIDKLKTVGKYLPELWNNDLLLSSEQKKRLIRSLVDKVIVERSVQAEELTARIVWKGNQVTTSTVSMPTMRLNDMKNLEELTYKICTMAKNGIDDKSIASQLNEQGFRSPTSDKLLPSTVTTIRLRNGVHRTTFPHPRRKAGHMSVPDIAKATGKHRMWILDRIYDGTIEAEMDPDCHCYLFLDDEKTLEMIKRKIQVYEAKQHGRKGHQDA